MRIASVRRPLRRLKRLWVAVSCKGSYLKAVAANGFRSETILFYPELPRPGHILYKVCHLLGYRMTKDIASEAVLAVHFEDTTWKRRDAVLDEIGRTKKPMANYRCLDISKSTVAAAFERIFGYPLAIDPRSYGGPCLRKSERNAAHDGEIVICPVEPEAGFVYQRLVDNRVGEEIVDLRVPVFVDSVPFILLKYRPVASRFARGSRRTEIREVGAVFSEDEVAKMLAVCREMGLDCGALDVLRDREDGRIYVVDVNDTPTGPPSGISSREYAPALRRLATAFQTQLVEPRLRATLRAADGVRSP